MKLLISITGLLLALTTGASVAATPNPEVTTHMEDQQTTMNANITTVRRFFAEVVNGGKLELIDEIMTPDYVMHAGSLGTYEGRDKYKAFSKANAGAAFSGMHLEVKRIVGDGDEVYALFTNSGTNTGPFLGQPPTHKYAKWNGFVLFRFEHGRIAESTYVEDLLDMFGQLGIKKLPN